MVKEIPLTKGQTALVDDADYERVLMAGAWQVSTCGDRVYAQHTGNRWMIRMHTYLTGWPLVDHINGNGLDNRRQNLRPATASQNGANISIPKHNTSGFKGVHFYKRTGRWRASITVNQVCRHLGYFATAEEAARVYDAAALEAWGEYARPNFPQEDVA